MLFSDILASYWLKGHSANWAWKSRWETWVLGNDSFYSLWAFYAKSSYKSVFLISIRTSSFHGPCKWQLLLISDNGNQVSVYGTDVQTKSSFYPFSGVDEELKTWLYDISDAPHKVLQFFKALVFCFLAYSVTHWFPY